MAGGNEQGPPPLLSNFAIDLLGDATRARAAGTSEAAWRVNMLARHGGHPAWQGRVLISDEKLKAASLWPW
jgi:hypothetical protein